MKRLSVLLRDLWPLLAVHGCLLIATLLASLGGVFPIASPLSDSLIGDAKVQLAWAAFLLPGWLLARHVTSCRTSFLRRYFAASVTSIAIHGVLAAVGSSIGLPLWSHPVAFGLVLVAALVDRVTRLSNRRVASIAGRRVSTAEIMLIAAVIIFSIAVFRTPRSNDIRQFILQQQDMVAEQSLLVSPIGMSGLGVDQPMPRWKSHLWHVLPCVLSVATAIPVDQILLRYGTIPLAMTVLLCLWFMISELADTKRHRWVSLAAILGPILIWYRSYNAFNYSFRLTNNFWLDKDICLFFLIPSVVYLACGWLRGQKQSGIALIILVPAILKFHPMNAVYLILLLPVIAIWMTPWTKRGLQKLSVISFAAAALFVAVLWIGDAQSYHRQVREIVTLDFADFQSGRPVHYWTGLYGAIPESEFQLDTSHWSGDVFSLKPSLIIGCGLLLVAHACFLVGATFFFVGFRSDRTKRLWLGLAATIALLWVIVVGSRFILTTTPHLSGGVERLHWFAYLPCIVGIATVASRLIEVSLSKENAHRFHVVGGTALSVFIVVSAALYAKGTTTPLTGIRGVNSLLDFDLNYNRDRQQYISQKSLDESPSVTRPHFLRANDTVLFLETKGKDTYWWIKQGVFWSDAYAEAFALHERGDSFLRDRKLFYAMVDRVPVEGVQPWLAEKDITLIVDRREGADEYLRNLLANETVDALKIEDGVWRIGDE